MSLKFFLNSDDFGIFPVPIAHLGSYAKIILFIFLIFFKAVVICLLTYVYGHAICATLITQMNISYLLVFEL